MSVYKSPVNNVNPFGKLRIDPEQNRMGQFPNLL